jgi:hypothetical protein
MASSFQPVEIRRESDRLRDRRFPLSNTLPCHRFQSLPSIRVSCLYRLSSIYDRMLTHVRQWDCLSLAEALAFSR